MLGNEKMLPNLHDFYVSHNEMKRISEPLGKHLDAANLSMHDLEYIESLFKKVAADVKYLYNGFEHNNIADLANHAPNVINKLEICSSEPYISINFGTRNIWLYTSSRDLVARGVFAELMQFLEGKSINTVKIRKTFLESIGIVAVFVGTVALIDRQFFEATLAGVTALIILVVNLFGFSQSRLTLSNNQQGFWGRNRDNLIIGLFTSAIITLVTAIIQLALPNAKS